MGPFNPETCNFFFFKIYLIYLFIYFLAVLGLRCGARASHCDGVSHCRAQAPGAQAAVVVACRLQQLWLTGSRAQAQQLWHTGLAAPRHVGPFQTRARTHVPCIGRRTLNHCATRKAPRLVTFSY